LAVALDEHRARIDSSETKDERWYGTHRHGGAKKKRRCCCCICCARRRCKRRTGPVASASHTAVPLLCCTICLRFHIWLFTISIIRRRCGCFIINPPGGPTPWPWRGGGKKENPHLLIILDDIQSFLPCVRPGVMIDVPSQ
jgi:hypothetical protein